MQANYRSITALVVMLVTAPAVAETGQAPDPESARRGAKVYEIYCVSCHGVKGMGEPRIPWSIVAPDYIRAPALNDTEHAWHHSDENLAQTILEGSPRTPRMPGWKRAISAQDATDLVAYIKSLWGKRALACQGPKHMSCM